MRHLVVKESLAAFRQVRCVEWRYLTKRVKSQQMRSMTMRRNAATSALNKPFAQLAIGIEHEWRQAFDVAFQLLAEVVINAKDAARLDASIVDVIDNGAVNSRHHRQRIVVTINCAEAILGRYAGTAQQPTCLRVFNHVVHEKEGCLFQQRIGNVLQVFLVERVLIMCPEMRHHPSTCGDIHGPTDGVSWCRIAPNVVDSVSYPAPATIHLPSGFASILYQHSHEAEERRVAFSQIGDITAPIVLLDVDVKMIVTRPRHIAGQVIVPNALQIGGQGRVLAARCYLHVTAILEEKRIESRTCFALTSVRD